MTLLILSDLDPGIRETVRWLREHGFDTTDSGDGVTKKELIASGHALPVPHVFMRVEPATAFQDARTLRNLLGPGIGRVEASYNPDDGDVALLALYEVNDETLKGRG